VKVNTLYCCHVKDRVRVSSNRSGFHLGNVYRKANIYHREYSPITTSIIVDFEKFSKNFAENSEHLSLFSVNIHGKLHLAIWAVTVNSP